MGYENIKSQGLYDPRFEHDACGVAFVCNVNGHKTHKIITQGLEVLRRLAHRGAVGADPKTGDGAGILLQMPHQYFAKIAVKHKIKLPDQGEYGTGLIFLPRDIEERIQCKDIFYRIIKKEGQDLLGWRQLDVKKEAVGKTAQDTMPIMAQVFIGKNKDIGSQSAFERKLYIIRRQIENAVRNSDLKQKSFCYITGLSSRTFIYKGLLMPEQVGEFFSELNDPDITSALALIHSRYSTNTFPSWDLAQPFRFLSHNGEINTLRGNINWMAARESLLQSELFGNDIEKLKPIIMPGGSDSSALDNVFELLLLAGYSLPEAMMTLIPEAWEQNKIIDKTLKSFYTYNACSMEPWDGPAAIAFTDGTNIGAVLDRNGLRPARYIITKDNFVIMASEMGVLDIDPAVIAMSGRLEPGKIFFIDTQEKRIVHNREIKEKLSNNKPYQQWLSDNLFDLDDLPEKACKHQEKLSLNVLLKNFGYTREDMKMIILPMAQTAYEPTGSMGNDTPHAVLSKNPQNLFSYFKQLFAQVTNPPIDPIREEIVMSLESYLGVNKNILEQTPKHCRKLRVKTPVLTDSQLEKIREINKYGFKTQTISTLFEVSIENDFNAVLERVCAEAEKAIIQGYTFIVLSDRGITKNLAALPSLLITSAVHVYLIEKSLRARASIIVESAEPREVHHFALLFGYGADCVNPYLSYSAIKQLIDNKQLSLEYSKARANYIEAIEKGILKILSKMGISTLRSYRGAQIFEAIGLHKEVIDKCFPGTVSRISGANLDILSKETILRHSNAFSNNTDNGQNLLPSGGVYQWKKDGEFHLWNPESITALQTAVRENNYTQYKEFARLINDQTANPATLRGLMKFKKQTPVPLDEVESKEEIFKRFVTGAMSFGSISKSSHETLALAMNRIHGKSNTGEGGEDPRRFTPLPNGDSLRSAVKQVASGRFGVNTNYLVNADELQIKIAQGAKPGEGGQLPGHKVSEIIAKTRFTTPGVTLISPPPHHDIYSIEDLAQLIFDLKNVNPKARISVKLVSEIGVGTIAAGVAKGHADMILISGFDGGTGASPKSSIKHAGLPWELGLAETHQTLVLNNLRDRVRLQTDGQMRTGYDVAIAALLGAEEYGFCTAALVVMGCVMLRHCHLNNCALGVATQDDILEKYFRGKVEEVISYFTFVAQELREIMAQLGFRTINKMIGRVDVLELNKDSIPWKAKHLDYSKLLFKPKITIGKHSYCVITQNHGIDKILDNQLIALAKPALEENKTIKIDLPINNTNRSCGAMLSGEVCGRFGDSGLTDAAIHCKFTGIAGQSFGAWLSKGIEFELEGMANDYVGKGLSGGRIIIYPNIKSCFTPEENVIIGNTAFYGAICGETYIRGLAGERFCIRNSGAYAVIEGIGDHGCEYMTGGRVVVIGKTGRNFGAGMSGGIAYVYDIDKDFKDKCNMEMVVLEKCGENDQSMINNLLNNHLKYTKSTAAKKILDNFKINLKYFVKVMPLEYKRILSAKEQEEKMKLTEVSD